MAEEILTNFKPYAMDQQKKNKLYVEVLSDLTDRQRKACAAYDRLLCAWDIPRGHRFSKVSEIPFLPVSVFKDLALKSIPDDKVYKVITSSGTTGQRLSKIFLDIETAERQREALYRIVSDFIGEKRLPYLILDSRKTVQNRQLFSARSAGILGFSVFASKMCFALDEDMQPDFDRVRHFLEQHQNEDILLFGFTYIVWKHFILELKKRKMTLPLSRGFLIHGGGWKKLASQAVDPEEYHRQIYESCGIANVRDYYGMAEQTGCICMECEYGHLHVSAYSDILIRNFRDFSVCAVGERGLIQVLSPIPTSYPGHSLLTEDIGVLSGTDDCPCGRRGKYFRVLGRAPKAEVRGCSDTYGE